MAEAASYRFRTAVGGFHKGDVSAYIKQTAGAHQAECAQLKQALSDAQQENETLRASLAELQAQLDAVHEPSDEDREERAAQEPDTSEHITELELGAYRRAEAAERLAYQRAGRLYADMQRIHDSALAQLEPALPGRRADRESHGRGPWAHESHPGTDPAGSRTGRTGSGGHGRPASRPAEGLEAAE